MTPLSEIRYVSAIRTRRAELLGFENVSDPFGRGLLPLFELTRSRRSKSNPEGAVEASISEVTRICGEQRFAVDITSQSSLMNNQLDLLLDPDAHFSRWRAFVHASLPQSVLPVVHLLEPFDADSFRTQLEEFLRSNDGATIRVPSDFMDVELLFDLLTTFGRDRAKIAIIADVGLVLPRAFSGALARASELAALIDGEEFGLFSSVGSSFPSTVTQLGGDATGEFDLQEVALSTRLQSEFDDLIVVHGDYACIHPLDLEGMAINWVPRVDVPLDESLFYHRYRRDAGGYVRAADQVLRDPRYKPINCWGHENIQAAAGGVPLGRSPSHWISVRLNYHIERQLARLG